MDPNSLLHNLLKSSHLRSQITILRSMAFLLLLYKCLLKYFPQTRLHGHFHGIGKVYQGGDPRGHEPVISSLT